MLDIDLLQALFLGGGTLLVYWGFKGHIIPRAHYRRTMEERDKWRQAAEVSTKTLAELADTSRAGAVIPKGVQVELLLDPDGVPYWGTKTVAPRKDWTKDRPGDYSPLPPETPEQLVARLDRQNLKEWTDEWQRLTGEPWESDEERDERRAKAAKESETIKAMEQEQTRILARMKRAAGLPFARGGIIRDGMGLPQPGFTPDPAGKHCVVEAGDTWVSIAAQFGVTVEDLARANPGVQPRGIQVGQVLALPKYRQFPKNPIPPSTRRTYY
jgi:hypothetical protein